jgi:benzoate membrane transport protein
MKSFQVSHVASGFVAVLVGYTSSAVIVMQAATSAGASVEQLGSWMWALGIGMGVTCIGLSLAYRVPVLTAWSTPGAALLVTSLAGSSMSEAIGIFLFVSLLITLVGLLGLTEPLLRRIPKTLAAAMLAGVLLRFGIDVFHALKVQWMLVGLMLTVWVLGRVLRPNLAVPWCLLTGLVYCLITGQIAGDQITLQWASPVWMTPAFSPASLIGVGLPLFLVTMASQNIPGLAVLRANGYQTPASPLMTATGVTGLVLAPFGGFTFNLAAITAAICMSPEADPDPQRRYRAAVWAGVFYLITGILGLTVASVFAAFPAALIAALAGIALIPTVGAGLVSALEEPADREAALITFLCTASGLTLWGVSSAFWGLVLGLLTLALRNRLRRLSGG